MPGKTSVELAGDHEVTRKLWEQKFLKTKLKETPPNKNTLFLGNLAPNTEQDDLKAFLTELFDGADQIKDLRVIKDEVGKSKGYAYLDLNNPLFTEEVIALISQFEYRGRKLRCDMDQRKVLQPPPTDKPAVTAPVATLVPPPAVLKVEPVPAAEIAPVKRYISRPRDTSSSSSTEESAPAAEPRVYERSSSSSYRDTKSPRSSLPRESSAPRPPARTFARSDSRPSSERPESYSPEGGRRAVRPRNFPREPPTNDKSGRGRKPYLEDW